MSTNGAPWHVCFMLDELVPAGTELWTRRLIDLLDRGVVAPSLCLLDGENEVSRRLEPRGVPVLRLGMKTFRHPSVIGKAIELARFLRRENVDILQVHHPGPTTFGVPIARLARVPRVVTTMYNAGYAVTPGERRLGRLYRKHIDRTIANCEACRETAVRNDLAFPESVVILQNGVDLERFTRPTRRPFEKGPHPVIGIVAHVRPVKDVETFVRAAARVGETHPDARFRIAGDGPSRPDLERLIAELNLAEKFEMLGDVKNVPGFLAGIDVAVLSSKSEGLPHAILEYMAAGVPTVSTAVGGAVEVLKDGVHGFLTPPGDPDALAAGMRRLLDDPPLAKKMGDTSRALVEERYSQQKMLERFQDFYTSLMTMR